MAVQAHRMSDAPAGPVAQPEEPVVDVLLVGGVEAGPAGRAPDEGERHVHEGHPQDEEGDEERSEEEVGHAAGGHRGGHPAADDHGGGRHEDAQEEGPGVAHEDPGRVEVEGQEAQADAAGDHGHQGADVVRRAARPRPMRRRP